MIRIAIVTMIAVFAAFSPVSPTEAQEKKMYSYTDEDGTVVYTDKAPGDREVKAQPIPAGPPLQGADDPYASAKPEASGAQQRRDEIMQGRKDARAAQDSRDTQCAAWEAEKTQIEPHRRQYYTDQKTGEVVRMDDVERAERVAELKRLIAENCN